MGRQVCRVGKLKKRDPNIDWRQPGHRKHLEMPIASQTWPRFMKGAPIVPLCVLVTGHELGMWWDHNLSREVAAVQTRAML